MTMERRVEISFVLLVALTAAQCAVLTKVLPTKADSATGVSFSQRNDHAMTKATTHPDMTKSTTHPDMTKSTTHPDMTKTTTHPDMTKSTTHPDKTTTHPDMTTTHPDKTTTHPDMTTTHPDKTTTHPDMTKTTTHHVTDGVRYFNMTTETSSGPKPNEDQGCTGLFAQQSYQATVNESEIYNSIPFNPTPKLCKNSTVYKVQVLNGDFPQDKFWFDNATLELKMRGVLDYETVKTVQILVQSALGTAVFTIDVKDVNDNPPVMLHNRTSVYIQEGAPIGTLVGIAAATDADSGENAEFEFHMVPGSPDNCPAKVDPKTGYMTLKEVVDYEECHAYICFVNAQETSTSKQLKSNLSELTIYVTDINDNPPQFTRSYYEFVMSWPVYNSQFVGKVTAYDRDSDSNAEVSYSIESPFDEILHVDNNTGEITVTDSSSYHFQQPRNVTFLLLVKDGGTPTLTGQVQVHIQLIKGYERWFFNQTAYTFSVREDAKPDDEVGEVHINSSKIIHYSIDSLNQTSLPFKISDNGIITVAPGAILDYETTTSYLFVVEARDTYAVVYVNVTVNVIDLNDNRPNFTNPSENKFRVFIDRLTKQEEVIFSVKAVDKDSGLNGNVSYRPTTSMDGNLFGIALYSGDVRLRQSAANINKDELHLVVEATDHGTSPHRRFIEIDFVINSDLFYEYYYTRIEETYSHGPQLRVASKDLLGMFYEIESDISLKIDTGNEDKIFRLSSANQLSAQPLDYETGPYRELTINVTGKTSNLLIGFIHVDIEVTDVNDNPPKFLPIATTSFDIPVTAEANSPIFQFVANDKDSPKYGDGVLTYALISGGDYVDLDPNTGVVKLKKSLQLTNNRFQVRATVNDTVNVATSHPFTFHVFDPQQNYPVFDKTAYVGSVKENIPKNSVVMRAIPTLSVSQNQHDVTIDVYRDQNFYATPSFDEVLTNTSLDREVRSQYTIGIQSVANHQTLRTTTVFALINVEDDNDNSPEFPFSVFRTNVSRNDVINVRVASIKAHDKDSISKLTYYKTGGPDEVFLGLTVNNTVRVHIRDPSQIPRNVSSLSVKLHVHDEMPSHNDTMELVITVR